MLIQIEECIFDQSELQGAHGFEELDPVGKEAFVNHIHFEGKNRRQESEGIIQGWIKEMKAKFPRKTFRIYKNVGRREITIRFHVVREGVPNWADSCDGIQEIDT